MKKLLMIFVAAVVTVTSASAQNVDSTKKDSTAVKTLKVKGFSNKEYTVIAGADTVKVKAGDTTHVVFAAEDSVKTTGKVDFQMIGGKKTKVKQIVAHGKKAWVKDSQDLSKPIEMWCDETETSDPISGGWYFLMALVGSAAIWVVWKFVLKKTAIKI